MDLLESAELKRSAAFRRMNDSSYSHDRHVKMLLSRFIRCFSLKSAVAQVVYAQDPRIDPIASTSLCCFPYMENNTLFSPFFTCGCLYSTKVSGLSLNNHVKKFAKSLHASFFNYKFNVSVFTPYHPTSSCGSRSEIAGSRCKGYPLVNRFCACLTASQNDEPGRV